MPAIILDFDGVIHPYNRPFDPENIPEPPTEETRAAIRQMLDMGWEVYVLSTRTTLPGGVERIQKYLDEHNIKVTEVVDKKRRAVVYVDDRGWRFEGDWAPLLEAMTDAEALKPWNKRSR